MDLSKYIYSECHDPVKIRIYDGIKNCYVYKYVPCGKCYHCKITRINEWVTRMVCQSNYSKYVYFGTLTYNGKKVSVYNNECLSVISNFNKNKSYNDTPIILRKDHLQKFFKRLRKNTGVKFQYAACGEYGSTYSRPHYHYIIWSNTSISKLDVYKAWTATSKEFGKKVIIGKIDHYDIKNNPRPEYNDPDGTYAFKYVCKYVQKCDFDFEKLTNIIQHKRTYEKEFNVLNFTNGEHDYLSPRIDNYLKSKGVLSWEDYKKAFGPFFVCSKQPAIGFQYLQDNLREFQKANFKLFGLPKEYIFPLYFIRKTKESLCPLKAQSETNSGVTSYSRLPKMEALLSHIIYAHQVADDTEQIIKLFRCDNQLYKLESTEVIQDLKQIKNESDLSVYNYMFEREYLGFVNIETRVCYSFRGDYYAMYNTFDDSYIGSETLENVKQLIRYYYDQLKTNILLYLYAKSEISADKKNTLIQDHYNGDVLRFEEDKKRCLEQLMNNIHRRQEEYKLTKTFE